MYKTVPLKYSMFYEKDNPVFGESATHISIDDDAGGGYIVLEQFPDDGPQKLRLDIDELKQILSVANKLMSEYNKITLAPPKPDPCQYIIEVDYSEYGDISYRFKRPFNGEVGTWEVGTWFDTKKEAIKQAENRINLR